MWNYNFVFPSLLVLSIILLYYFARPRLPIRMNRTFLKLLAVDVLVILTDILSSKADEQFQLYSQGVLTALNLGYFVLFILRILYFFQFTLDVLRVKTSFRSGKSHLLWAVFYLSEAVVLSSPITGAVFSIDISGYHRGPLYVVLPICAFFYLALGVGMLLIFRKKMKRGDFLGAMGYHAVLIVGNAVRILMPQYLVMNVFCLSAVLIIFLSFENPDLYLSDRGLAFNSRAFLDVLDDSKRGWRILGFVLRDYNDERGIYGGAQMDQGLNMIIQYLVRRYPQYMIFYLRSGCFAIVGQENMETRHIRADILSRFQKPWRAEDADLYLHVSFAEIPSTAALDTADKTVNTLLICLDRAAQSAEPDHVVTPDSLQEVEEHLIVKRHLERALEQDSVEIFLQPLMDAKTRDIVAAEALARIRDEDGHLISPDVFIPIAEKNGLINQMGEQVLRKTCHFIRTHDMDAMGLQWINVNLSPIQCMRSDLAERFDTILAENKVDAGKIHLEITEQSMIDYSLLEKQVDSLKECGFQFALDDYGAGYSNLSRVKHCPFVNIKLDMEIVWDYIHNRDSLLPTLVQTFKKMHFSITAEGIETEEMADAMADIECDYLQGFYFSRPLPMDEFVEKYSP